MSFKTEKREFIKRYMLEKIYENRDEVVNSTADVFDISLNTVYRYLKELIGDNVIIKTNAGYALVQKKDYISLSRSKDELKSEDVIYDRYVKKYVDIFDNNIIKIWQYAFMEMMNNAIDHSLAENVDIVILQNYINTTILIIDDGIGIFKKIKDYFNYETLDDAVDELFKGKLTTDSYNHSGEGIFFTSHILDRFAAISNSRIFTHDKYPEMVNSIENIEMLNRWKDLKGTIILMELSNFSKKNLEEVFDMFSTVDGGFAKTRIPIKNIFETYPVSRSQAKRLCQRFEKFKEIELDFDEIDDIGQGFAHEIFVVFQRNNPEIKLIPVNANTSVEKMIKHVKATVL
ncbi:MAG: STAS-like domain-containing protein [Lachnospiraceae bacterium]|nr:STAS-like domain-containing protein [Lachnospiraceae bacterium]